MFDYDPDCCIFACVLEKNGIVYNTTYENGSTSVDVSTDAIVRSFMLSIGNEEQWIHVISKTVQRCYDQFMSLSDFDCDDRVPMSLYDITDCCYNENYVKCPTWNPSGLEECDYTLQYFSQCFDFSMTQNDSDYFYYE